MSEMTRVRLRLLAVVVFLGGLAGAIALWIRSDAVLGWIVLGAGIVISGWLWWVSGRSGGDGEQHEEGSSAHQSGRILRW